MRDLSRHSFGSQRLVYGVFQPPLEVVLDTRAPLPHFPVSIHSITKPHKRERRMRLSDPRLLSSVIYNYHLSPFGYNGWDLSLPVAPGLRSHVARAGHSAYDGGVGRKAEYPEPVALFTVQAAMPLASGVNVANTNASEISDSPPISVAGEGGEGPDPSLSEEERQAWWRYQIAHADDIKYGNREDDLNQPDDCPPNKDSKTLIPCLDCGGHVPYYNRPRFWGHGRCKGVSNLFSFFLSAPRTTLAF